jgi:hypothetical protein
LQQHWSAMGLLQSGLTPSLGTVAVNEYAVTEESALCSTIR